ncbi:unnamed protein product [Medioppia subpectinata]|uniref:Transcription factor 25 n=1 Tax=Medioppia subpectinata TaxID=1979941 RepID=A0A7R9KII5_9ACAR|nr:unnamed protein product [Medioppia subpectinata]CAG2104004.1 unnamed protein product [Medioppia subpectinata]
MSNRVLKKLYGDNHDVLKATATAGAQPESTRAAVTGGGVDNHMGSGGGSDSDSLTNDKTSGGPSPAVPKHKKLALNRFELLNNLDQNSMSDTEAKEDDDKDNDSARAWLPVGGAGGEKSRLEKQDSTQSTDSLKKRRRKKKKIRSQKSLEGQLDADPDDEDIDATVEEVNKLLGNCHELNAAAAAVATDKPVVKKSVIAVEARHLNPENEMKRMFGSKVVAEQQQHQQQGGSGRRRGPGRGHRPSISRSWILVNPRNWQNVGKSGLTMDYVEKVGDSLHFRIAHNRSYQSVQHMFADAVESYNPDNLIAILNAHPYHIDTIIQFSDVCKMAEDNQMAAELIERALYCIEHTFHPLFNVTQATCRLDYRRPENRAFYIALFKHLTFVGQRGCNRTALEFCKLILGLDPEGDPLSVLLMIDFYALRCEQYDYLLTLASEWETSKKLSLFPNIRYSTALALYYLSQKAPDMADRADHQLQEALIMFPGVLLALLDKCSVEPDPRVAKCDYFRCPTATTPVVTQLNVLYIGRTHLLWKDRHIMSWLERNVRTVMDRVANRDPFVTVCAERSDYLIHFYILLIIIVVLIHTLNYRRKKYLSGGTPRNVLRHVILSGIKEATLALPNDLAKDTIFGFDPLPPTDTIISYTRPPKPAADPQTQANADQNILSVFLRSWLPDFNADELIAGAGGVAGGAAGVVARNRAAIAQQMEQRRGQRGAAAVGGADEPAGAVGGRAPGDTHDLRRSVTSLLDAMRDLLSNIHMTDVPNEGDVSSEDNDDEEQHQHRGPPGPPHPPPQQ